MKLPTLLACVGILGLSATLLLGQTGGSNAQADAQETYFASGQIESRVEYSEGRREGTAQRFFANGSTQSTGRYTDGRMEGEWHFWNADGSIDAERTGSYRAGERIATDAAGAGS